MRALLDRTHLRQRRRDPGPVHRRGDRRRLRRLETRRLGHQEPQPDRQRVQGELDRRQGVKESSLGPVPRAQNSARLEGQPASRFLDSCPQAFAPTIPVGDVCVETQARPPRSYGSAVFSCALTDNRERAGRRLPTHQELMAALGAAADPARTRRRADQRGLPVKQQTRRGRRPLRHRRKRQRRHHRRRRRRQELPLRRRSHELKATASTTRRSPMANITQHLTSISLDPRSGSPPGRRLLALTLVVMLVFGSTFPGFALAGESDSEGEGTAPPIEVPVDPGFDPGGEEEALEEAPGSGRRRRNRRGRNRTRSGPGSASGR